MDRQNTNITPRENALMAYRHETPMWIPTFLTDMKFYCPYFTIEKYLGTETGKDMFGVSWTYEPNVAACMVTPWVKPVLEDIADWREVVKFPDLDALDWEAQSKQDMSTVTPEDEDKLFVVIVLNGPFERLHALMGMENALCALVEDPEACYDFFGAMADHKIAYYKKVKQYYRVDLINGHDDYGTNDRMFMSPETWRKLIKPHLKRIVDAVHEMGLPYQHHSCGYIEPIIEDLVEIGVDAIDTLQACNKNVGELKKKFGKQITFCGGFDSYGVLDYPGVTPEQIKAEYRRVIDLLAPGGSYVAYPITATYDFAPHFIEEHYRYGMGFYNDPANR